MAVKKKDMRSQITSNMEDYLESIHELSRDKNSGEVRVTDIAKRMRVTRPSVVGMIKHLVEHGLARHDHYGGVSLTGEGIQIAREMWHRHQVLRRFLEEVLGLDAEIAEMDACGMEHSLGPETIDRFIALGEFREAGGEDVIQGAAFRKFLRERRLEKSRKKTERNKG